MPSPRKPPALDMDVSAQDRGTQARQALIAAAIQEFSEFGPDGASTRAIAQRAGQNIASIAYYFENKEGLYLAVMRHVVQVMTRRSGPLLDEIEDFLARPEPDRPAATSLKYLQRLMVNLFYGGDALVALSQLIVREQTHPTAGFEILFKGWLERLHTLGAGLIAAHVGGDAKASEFTVRYHMLLGSVLGFRVARQTLLRRLAWSDWGDEDKAQLADLIAEHVELVLKGLRRRRQRSVHKRGHPS